MATYAPGMRIIVRGEEWMIKRVETNSLGNQTLQVVGITSLVNDYESRFMTDLEKSIEIVDPAKVKIVPDDSPFFKKSKGSSCRDRCSHGYGTWIVFGTINNNVQNSVF